ncbi:hypothetical protein U1Q18_003997, partial [Sarracenia purpurea var. burkii]
MEREKKEHIPRKDRNRGADKPVEERLGADVGPSFDEVVGWLGRRCVDGGGPPWFRRQQQRISASNE